MRLITCYFIQQSKKPPQLSNDTSMIAAIMPVVASYFPVLSSPLCATSAITRMTSKLAIIICAQFIPLLFLRTCYSSVSSPILCYNVAKKGGFVMLDTTDIVPCRVRRTMVPIILHHQEDGTINTTDCPLDKCDYFNICKISKNHFVQKSLKRK